MASFPEAFENLIEELKKLPGIGPRTAYRLAFFIFNCKEEDVKSLANALIKAKSEIRVCQECFSLADGEMCAICKSEDRDRSVICVVEEPKDVFAIEKTREFKGVYHVLGGALSPIDGIGPEELRINELLRRIKERPIKEVIIATNPTVSGEATAIYLAKILKEEGVKVTRLASGIPYGGDIDFADEITLARALESRRVL